MTELAEHPEVVHRLALQMSRLLTMDDLKVLFGFKTDEPIVRLIREGTLEAVKIGQGCSIFPLGPNWYIRFYDKARKPARKKQALKTVDRSEALRLGTALFNKYKWMRDAFDLMAATGLRPAELRRLRWSDVA